MSTTGPKLAALGDLADYRVCTEDTDPRGWNVVDCDAVALGKVSDLIVDLEGLTARYIVCTTSTRAVLIPTGFARLDHERCTVHLDYVTADDLDRLPAFTGLPLSREDTSRLEAALTGAETTNTRTARIVRREVTHNAS